MDFRRQGIKRVDIGDIGIVEEQRTLTEIVEQQAGEDNAIPAKADGQAPKMTHIGIKRLASGNTEDHGC